MIREFRFGDYINSNFKSIQRKLKVVEYIIQIVGGIKKG